MQKSKRNMQSGGQTMKKAFRGACWLVLLCTLAVPAFAQQDKASVSGTLSDPSRAAVAGAKVVVRNVATGFKFEATTNDLGYYSTPAILPPGIYTLEIAATGFKSVSQRVTLQIGDAKELNFSLQVGAVTETVEVTSDAPQLNTTTSETGNVITGRQITELPLKDRNFTQLATLTPGVSRAYVGVLTDARAFNQGDGRFGQGDVSGASNTNGSSEASRFSRSGGASISVNGLRPTNNNFSLDGVDNNEPQFGSIGVFPNPDAIEEFKIETSVAKSEEGRGGATINTIYRSGTNDIHGSLFYYGQNDALNATAFEIGKQRHDLIASGASSTPPVTITPQQAAQQIRKSRIHVNEFGATVGGAIVKNKTFYFFDYLGNRNSTPNSFDTVVPTALSRAGNFSEYTSPIIDPQTCTKPGDISSGGCTNFPGNIIPNLQSRPDFSAQAFKFFALYPNPTVNVTDPNNSTGHFNFFGTRRNVEQINNYDVKIDHQLTTKNHLNGRYSFDNLETDRANFFPKVPTAGFGAGNEVGNTRGVVVSDTHIFRPTLLNEFKFGWTQVEIGIKNCGVEGACGISPTACTDLGIPNCNHGTPPTTGGILTGGFGTGFFEFSGDGGLFLVHSNNYYVSDAVTIISGKHTWKAGVQARPRYLTTIDGGRSGGLKGQLQYGAGQPQSTGNVQSDYLLSRPAIFASNGAVSGNDAAFHLRTTEWGFFVQDDWKATPSLTLNLGARYDLFPAPHEANGRLANYDVATRQIVIAKGSGDSTVATATGNVGPRVGFAYNFGPNKKMVLRGGYGIFYSQDGVDYPPTIRNPPETGSVGLNGGGFFGGTANCILTPGPPVPACNLTTGPPVVSIANPPVITPGSSLFAQQFSQKSAHIEEFNLQSQWEFAKDWLLDVGYVGTRSRHLLTTRNVGNSGNGLGIARTPTGAVSSTNPNPDSPIGNVEAYEPRGSANYDSLQVGVDKRFSQGFLFHGAYTWSHNIDDSTGVFQGLGDGRGSLGGPANPLNLRGDRGNSSLDHRHLFVANLVWDLPIGKGKRMASNAGPGLDKVIGGWQANYIWSAGTGQHYTVVTNGASRANLLCAPGAVYLSGGLLNPACFSAPTAVTAACPGGGTTNVGAVAPATFVRNLDGTVDCLGNVGSFLLLGNSSRNQFTGPGYFQNDISVFKNWSIRERYRVQFGIELFNAFNKVNHVVPNNNFSNGDFHVFDNAFPPRTIQYRMKVFF